MAEGASRGGRWSLYRLLVVSGLVMSAVAPTASVAEGPDPGETVDRGFGSAQAFRLQEGLRADDDWVRRAVEDREAFPDTTWGTPLSESEASEMNRRVAFQRAAESALHYAQDLPQYSGAMFDPLQGSRLTIFVTGHVTDVRDEVARLLPDGSEFSVEKVDRTLNALSDEKARISARWKELVRQGVQITAVNVDVPRNRVSVDVLDVDDAARDAIHEIAPNAVLREATPKVIDACDPDACSDVWGGIRINFLDGGSWANFCTSGYMARRTDGTHANLVMVTAGHCIWESGGTNWKHNGTVWGTENSAHGFAEGSLGDVAFIDYDSEDEPTNKNRYLAFPSAGSVNRITGFVYWGDQIMGHYLCRIGVGSWDKHAANSYYVARRCGHITVYDSDSLATNDPRRMSVDAGVDHMIHYMKVWSWDSWPGDSGGIVVEHEGGADATRLMGTHVHSDNHTYNANAEEGDGESWYTAYTQGTGELLLNHGGMDLDLCVNAACD